ncbi:SDR family NAD(P)-dependent oxidoreductase [Hypericibacter sp.]|uniref:SDR family NAD(P)-dependent oxidoreductase n=1 Tax=Hypericibacter sp. TaxID=2705401 RepID=UPI003D6DA3F8
MGGRLQGKCALVYGGGTGIGLACAEAYAREGAAVFVSGRRESRLQEAVSKLSRLGKAGYEPGDATIESDVARVTAKAVAFMGGLDTLLVSSGDGHVGSIFAIKPEDFRRVSDANILPLLLGAQAAAPHLLKAGKGSITAVSSMYGLVGQKERIAYCTSKAAVIGMVRAMALDFADKGVRVNALCPGYVETELALQVVQQEADPEEALRRKRLMHAIPRAGRLEEVASAAVYFAADDAAFTTGQALAMDGGYTIR